MTARPKHTPITLAKRLGVDEWIDSGRDAMADAYWRLVERMAARFRRGFESGRYRGWLDEDDERMDRVRGGKTGKYDPSFEAPMLVYQRVLAERLFGRPAHTICDLGKNDFRARRVAMFILLCSPYASSEHVMQDDPENQAADALSLDVLQYARGQGWTKAQKGETPAFRQAVAA